MVRTLGERDQGKVDGQIYPQHRGMDGNYYLTVPYMARVFQHASVQGAER